MKVNKAYKYRINPTVKQSILIDKTIGCVRFIYNKMLEDKIRYYQETKQMLNNTPAQYKNEFVWLKEVDSLALANAQMNLQSAYKNFFTVPKNGFPKYKSKKRSKLSYITNNVNNGIRTNCNHHIHLPKLGWVKFVEHRQIPEEYKIKSVTVSKSATGKYYISILTEYEYAIPTIELDTKKSLGLDYSSHEFYVDSQNKTPKNLHHYYREMEDILAKEQRKLSHMKLKSSNYLKQKVRIAKVH